jgi:hypothetical protein
MISWCCRLLHFRQFRWKLGNFFVNMGFPIYFAIPQPSLMFEATKLQPFGVVRSSPFWKLETGIKYMKMETKQILTPPTPPHPYTLKCRKICLDRFEFQFFMLNMWCVFERCPWSHNLFDFLYQHGWFTLKVLSNLKRFPVSSCEFPIIAIVLYSGVYISVIFIYFIYCEGQDKKKVEKQNKNKKHVLALKKKVKILKKRKNNKTILTGFRQRNCKNQECRCSSLHESLFR